MSRSTLGLRGAEAVGPGLAARFACARAGAPAAPIPFLLVSALFCFVCPCCPPMRAERRDLCRADGRLGRAASCASCLRWLGWRAVDRPPRLAWLAARLKPGLIRCFFPFPAKIFQVFPFFLPLLSVHPSAQTEFGRIRLAQTIRFGLANAMMLRPVVVLPLGAQSAPLEGGFGVLS